MRYAIRQYHHSAESTFGMTRSRRILVYDFVYDVICISAISVLKFAPLCAGFIHDLSLPFMCKHGG
jgi:hypothetical protein